MTTNVARIIASELGVQVRQCESAISLMDDGASVPFIARYRKEATGSLDDQQLRRLEARLSYLRELEERRTVVTTAIAEQGKLDQALRRRIEAAATKSELEDLYLPFRKKRRTKAQLAREAGLEPLAVALRQDPSLRPEREARKYLRPEQGIDDVSAALDGAAHILMEVFAEDAALVGELRAALWNRGVLSARVVSGQEESGQKFSDYFDYREAIARIPPHRAMALFRGRTEGILSLALDLERPAAPESGEATPHPCEAMIATRFEVRDRGRPADAWLAQTVRGAWRKKLHRRIALDIEKRLREAGEVAAIEVFTRNLRDLLLAAPAGARTILGLDPALRTGVKAAVVDDTGQLLQTTTVYPHAPQKRWEEALRCLAELAERHGVELIAIGNGTASRETNELAAELLRRHPRLGLQKITVSEAGASVYSASELAAKEMPDVDVSLRGAVSIARRLQDPLAELVKVAPKSIGVGQYQHDVDQARLERSLDAVVEDCVNSVGVDVNTASPALLARVSGLSTTLANNIVEYRNAERAFATRGALKKVPRLGAKAYQQCAGFLRIVNGASALDATSVHPEAYAVVERIAADTGHPVPSLTGNAELLRGLDPNRYTDDRFGLPTVRDIIAELEKPGRDPRPAFKTAKFRAGVTNLADLEPGMLLEGVVTNVTHFGAFVDIGVHQDGLVHISALADRYVRDPHEVVSNGDIVRVKVLEVDVTRRRIGLTMRLGDGGESDRGHRRKPGDRERARGPSPKAPTPRETPGALGDALLRARKAK